MTGGKLYEMLRNLLKKKPEWGTPVSAPHTPPGVGAWSGIFSLAFANPLIIAIEIDIRMAAPGDSGVVTIEKKVNGVDWVVIGNAEYDDVDFSLIDDCPPTPSLTAPKNAHQWVLYVDDATGIRASVKQAGGPHLLWYNYNTKGEV